MPESFDVLPGATLTNRSNQRRGNVVALREDEEGMMDEPTIEARLETVRGPAFVSGRDYRSADGATYRYVENASRPGRSGIAGWFYRVLPGGVADVRAAAGHLTVEGYLGGALAAGETG